MNFKILTLSIILGSFLTMGFLTGCQKPASTENATEPPAAEEVTPPAEEAAPPAEEAAPPAEGATAPAAEGTAPPAEGAAAPAAEGEKKAN